MFSIFLIVLVALVLWGIWAYNRLVRLAAQAKEAWADIDVQLKRRYDLIPNLVETVKGYAAHEKDTLAQVVAARTAAMGARTLAERGKAEQKLAGTLASLFAVAEAYPQLKANENFLALQNELTDTENKIQAARRFYNTSVRDLNISIESFPSNAIARTFGFGAMEFFQLDASPAEREPIHVAL